ncbi:MAG: hypothetical protein EBZ62_04875, partial [Sphingobacteriia bacterium]|nr:hypothetical protein [Sphingobacteriia bacterium]
EMILEEVKAKLEKGKEVKISGFGKWIVKEKRSRPGRNPHTGQKIEITARRVVTFHPGLADQQVLNGVVEHMPQMQNPGDIGWGNDYGIGLAFIGLAVEASCFHPAFVPAVLQALGLVLFGTFHD